jgi:hypothetical protein
MVVHLWHGQTEAHFHFFVVVDALRALRGVAAVRLAFLYVVLHHTRDGRLSPDGGLLHGGNPSCGPACTAGFILALGAANTITWRLNEDARAERCRRAPSSAPRSTTRRPAWSSPPSTATSSA